ncbi:unnamed protein product [Brassica oleracea]|uniref:(rape) hypothetical protein n=1 Tax=Brassica napus TaxID=3708 RepID=A0A816JEL1_BRANA|nr:unnamed protein product [Brassica napus]
MLSKIHSQIGFFFFFLLFLDLDLILGGQSRSRIDTLFHIPN